MAAILISDFGDETLEVLAEAKANNNPYELAKRLIDNDFAISEIRDFLKKELKMNKKDFDQFVKIYLY